MTITENLAIPKKGRVYEQVLKLMLGAGLVLKREARLDFCICKALGIGVYFLPAKDIPHAVASGAVQYGVTGIDLIKDSGVDIDTHLNLGIGKARMVLASPLDKPYENLQSLNGKRIGSSYLKITDKFLKENNVTDYQLIHFSGSVEVQASMGVVDAIVDITETGSSLVANRLEIREEILTSEMVLIGSKGHKGDILDLLIKRLQRVIRAKSHVLLKFNIHKGNVSEACALSHGMSSPTINKLAESDSVAMEVAIPKKELHKLMDELIELGATGILAHELSLCAPD